MYNLKYDDFPKGDMHFEHLICTCQKAQSSLLGIFVRISIPKKENPTFPFFSKEGLHKLPGEIPNISKYLNMSKYLNISKYPYSWRRCYVEG